MLYKLGHFPACVFLIIIYFVVLSMTHSSSDNIHYDFNKAIVAQVGGAATEFHYRFPLADNLFVVQKDAMLELLSVLKENEFFGFSYLSDLFVVDNFGKEFRFVLICRVANYREKSSAIVICANIEAYPFASLSGLYPAAEWPEREAWEMFGTYFTGHKSLRRLLTDYGFRGYPLRKDFPMSGYLECFYSLQQNRIEFVKVEFMQEYRKFEFYNNWIQDSVESDSFGDSDY